MNTPEFAHVPLADIEMSATNEMFRDDVDFEGTDFAELMASIKKDGVIQPVLLRIGTTKKYQLVCGERRYRASLGAQTQTIPSYIRALSDDEAIQLQIVENLKRKDINPIKEAHAYMLMQQNMKVSAAEIAKRIDKSADYVEERLRLNKLKPEVQDYVRKGIIPLKAALKISRIPEHLHIEAIKECTDSVDGAHGKTIIFTGLGQLQDWLNYNVFNDLASAEFDKEDTRLVPSAGNCTGCNQRTKNTGGLFDDISKKDVCLNGACFRDKLTAYYLRLKEELQAKHANAEIVFKIRGYSKDEVDQKKITPLLDQHTGSITTEKHAKEDKNAKLAIYVGEAPSYGGIAMTKKTDWITTSKVKEPKVATTPQEVAARQKEKDEKVKDAQLQYYEAELMSSEFFKHSKTLNPDLLRLYIANAIDSDDLHLQVLLPALKAMAVDWTMIKREGKNEFNISCKAADADVVALLAEGDYIMTEKIADDWLSKVTGEALNALFALAMYHSFFGTKTAIIKAMKIDSKSVSGRAKEKLATWWKEEQARRKAPAPAAAGKVVNKKKQAA